MIIQRSTETIRYILWGLAVLIMSAVVLWLVHSDSELAIRPYVTFFYLLYFPGRAWIRCLHLPYPVMGIVYSIPLSLAIIILIGQIILYGNFYSVENGVRLAAAITNLGVIVEGILLMIMLRQNKALYPTKA